jgi:hypothetical protein
MRLNIFILFGLLFFFFFLTHDVSLFVRRGIAWYMNNLLMYDSCAMFIFATFLLQEFSNEEYTVSNLVLIFLCRPILEMRRGTTYTFRVHGGDTPESSAEYHPFYITNSSMGGYMQLNASERALETVYAGIDNVVFDDSGGIVNFTSLYVAPICLYQTTETSINVSLSGTYAEFYDTLDVSCQNNSTIVQSAAVFEFTPNETTPDTLYYQCVTHRNLGYKIVVLDSDDPPLTPMPTAVVASPINPAPVVGSPTNPVPVLAPSTSTGSALSSAISIKTKVAGYFGLTTTMAVVPFICFMLF